MMMWTEDVIGQDSEDLFAQNVNIKKSLLH
jgi:hypothetical protein